MIDHIGIAVSNFARSKAFYEKALASIGYGLIMEVPQGPYAGFGESGKPDFWIDGTAKPATKMHLAFAVKDRKTVDAFYAACLAAGAKDNGPPGLRPIYHASYYGAFVLDPDGYNIEAVCHAPA